MIYKLPFLNLSQSLLKFISLFLISGVAHLAAQETSFYQDEVYLRNPRSGAFQQVTRTLKLMAAPNPNSTQMKPTLIQDLGAVETCQLSLFRKGDLAELQFYCLPSDLNSMPSIQKRNLTLVKGTWNDFESGQTVRAQMVDEEAVKAGFQALATSVQKFLNHELMSTGRSPSQATPQINTYAVKNIHLPQVELKGAQIKITYSAQ